MFFGLKMRFPHENNAIFHRFFHGVSVFGLGLILGAFWGLLGAPLGALWHPLKPQLGHFADCWCPGRRLGRLLGPIWCSVGWFCALFGALWRKAGHQLDDFVSLGVKFGFFGVFSLWITFFPYLWSQLVEFVDIGSAGLDLVWIALWLNKFFYFLNGWIHDNLFVSFTLTVFMALLVSMHCICWQRAAKCLQTFKLDWCSLGIFATLYHLPKISMRSNVCIAVLNDLGGNRHIWIRI